MKTYSLALQTYLGKSLVKLATCILITRTDGKTYGFTTNRKSLTIGSIVYYPAFSFVPTDTSSSNTMDTDNTTMTALQDDDTLTEDELRAGRWDYAEYRIFQVNYTDLSMGDKKDSTGHLAQVTMNREAFVADLLGLMEAYSISVGEITSPGCRANLGDRRCKVVLVGSPTFIVNSTIDTADADFFTVHDAARTEPDTWFNEGVVVFHFASGDLSYEVKDYTVGQWVTKTAIAYDSTGVDYTMTRGCDRRFETCRDVFHNTVNFRGENHLRGNDALMQVGRHNP